MNPDEHPARKSSPESAPAGRAPLESVPTRVAPTSVPPAAAEDLERINLASRYLLGEKLGAGGMGIVVEAYDPRMRRELAIKRPISSRDDGARILAEARIQSGLEHPAIVPVYEVGRDLEGRAYFTMRRLEGTSLAEVLLLPGASRDSLVSPRWSTTRLLRGYVDVCLAVEYAHSRGVVHCDLKPGNVLFGEFGEVYVLDWGTARRYRAGSDPDIDPVSRSRVAEGTPSYMAREQFKTNEPLSPATDVFALGAMLYEILVGEPLHADKSTALQIEAEYEQGLIHSSPIERAPDRAISPELDWLCQAALRIEPGERISSARQLAEGVQAYLDGDRDLERRRTIASVHLHEAEELLESYVAEPEHTSVRAAAFAEAARALSYDPTHEGARDMVTRLLFDAPVAIPAEVIAEVDRQDLALGTRQSDVVVWAYVALLALTPLFLLGGIRSPALVLAIVGLTALLLANALDLRRRPPQPKYRFIARAVGDALLIGLTATIFGPLVLPPAAAVMAATLYAGAPATKRPWLFIAGLAGGASVPLLLAWTGVWNSLEITEDALITHASLVRFNPTLTWIGLVVFPPALVTMAAYFRGKSRSASRAAALRHELQRWHLRQVVRVSSRDLRDAEASDRITPVQRS